MSSVAFRFNRIMASLIDGLIMFLLFVAITIMPIITFIKDAQAGHFISADFIWMLFSIFGAFCVWILYLFLSSLIFGKATLGMRINKLVYTRSNGTTMSFKYLLNRSLVVVIGVVFSLGFSLIVNLVSMICSENAKNFYDIFSSTKVVKVDDF